MKILHIESNLTKNLWSKAIKCTTYQLNRLPSNAIWNKILADILFRSMDLSRLRIFQAKALAIILTRRNKLDKKIQEMKMIGDGKTWYRLYNP